jgi:hypothetical protein
MTNLRAVLLLSSSMFAAGCANLEAVNQTAGALVSASSSWDAVAEEFEASCARRNLMVATTADMSDCQEEKRATESLDATNKVLASYFSALQQASTTSNFSVEPGLSAVATAADGLPGVQANQVDAVKQLASYLSGLVTRGIEERTVRRLVADGAPQAEAVLDVLIGTAAVQLERQYRDERRITFAAFASYAQQSGTVFNVSDDSCANLAVRSFATGTGYLLGQSYCARVAPIEAREAALTSYRGSLQRARQTLVELQRGVDDLSAKDLAKQLGAEASELKKDIQAVKQAFLRQQVH